MRRKLLSVIVPAYKQEKTIVRDLLNIESVLKQVRFDYEIICVVDGKVDRTFEKASRIKSKKLRVVGYDTNRGKGYAVRYGMVRARGDLVAFIDAGMEIDPNGISLVLEHMEWYQADIIVGSKRHPASQVTYPWQRKVISFLYQLFVRVFTGLNIRDTQAGLKIYRREVLDKILPRLLVKRYAFDLEMLVVGHHLGFKRIYEAPLKLNYRFDDLTHAVVLKDFFGANGLWRSFIDTLAIIYRLRLLRYYDGGGRGKWANDWNLEISDAQKIGDFEKGQPRELVSVIIPVRTITNYVKETMAYLKKQTHKNFEIIVVTDQKERLKGAKAVASGEPTPAYKRNMGASVARGTILAFLDDDSYPETDWLENALKVFSRNERFEGERPVVGVCGPALTPPSDNIYQKASGWVWASFFGSGGAGVYRNRVMPEREVRDYPSVNLLVRKDDFFAIGGFDINHWPGEDTKLCLDLIQRGKIIYSPTVVVYHHRRAVFLPHLQQIARYAKRRGFFARNFPQTSFKAGYLLPSLFSYGLLIGCALAIVSPAVLIILASLITLYIIILFFSTLEVIFNGGGLYLTFLVAISIYLTHFVYGLLFPFGYFQRMLQTIPHKVDVKKGVYIGG